MKDEENGEEYILKNSSDFLIELYQKSSITFI